VRLVETLSALVRELHAARTRLVNLLQELTKKKSEREARIAALEAKRRQYRAVLAELEQKRAAEEVRIVELNKAAEELERQMQALGQLLRCRIAVRTQHQQLTHLTQQGITGGHQGTFPLTLDQGLTQRFRIGGRQRAIQPLHRLRRPDTCPCLAITHRHRPVIHGPASGWRLALQPDFRHQGQVRENKLHAAGHAAQHGTEQHIAYRSGQHHFRHQLEEQPAVPREDEVEARTPEERTDHYEHRPEHEVHRHERDGELAVLGCLGRVLVDVWRHHQEEQADSRDGHACHHRVEHGEHLLEAQEVPRRLGWVGGLVEVGQVQQGSVHEDREQQREQGDCQCRQELGYQQVGPDVHLVDGNRLGVLDGPRLDDSEQPLVVTLGSAARYGESSGWLLHRSRADQLFDGRLTPVQEVIGDGHGETSQRAVPTEPAPKMRTIARTSAGTTVSGKAKKGANSVKATFSTNAGTAPIHDSEGNVVTNITRTASGSKTVSVTGGTYMSFGVGYGKTKPTTFPTDRASLTGDANKRLINGKMSAVNSVLTKNPDANGITWIYVILEGTLTVPQAKAKVKVYDKDTNDQLLASDETQVQTLSIPDAAGVNIPYTLVYRRAGNWGQDKNVTVTIL